MKIETLRSISTGLFYLVAFVWVGGWAVDSVTENSCLVEVALVVSGIATIAMLVEALLAKRQSGIFMIGSSGEVSAIIGVVGAINTLVNPEMGTAPELLTVVTLCLLPPLIFAINYWLVDGNKNFDKIWGGPEYYDDKDYPL